MAHLSSLQIRHLRPLLFFLPSFTKCGHSADLTFCPFVFGRMAHLSSLQIRHLRPLSCFLPSFTYYDCSVDLKFHHEAFSRLNERHWGQLVVNPASSLCYNFKPSLGGSPGLVVMGRDSRSKGRGFESRHGILDGNFSPISVVKIVMMFVWKDQK